eukprot:7050036-Pyramimonas_sp.AAC.1
MTSTLVSAQSSLATKFSCFRVTLRSASIPRWGIHSACSPRQSAIRRKGGGGAPPISARPSQR